MTNKNKEKKLADSSELMVKINLDEVRLGTIKLDAELLLIVWENGTRLE